MKAEKIPLIDCPFDYLFGEASGKVLNEYGRFPCQIQCAVYAFMLKGNARATLNITKYEFKENDLIYVKPGSFFLVHSWVFAYYVLNDRADFDFIRLGCFRR